MRPIFFALVVSLLLGPASAYADLRPAPPASMDPGVGFSDPVSLSRTDRLALNPQNGPVLTVYVSMGSTWLNETERNMIMQTLRNKYSFASTLINFTTVKPTSGSFHQITVEPGRDPTTADGIAWGEAWSTSANVYGGEFTQDPKVSSWFSNSTARSNAIGENIAHELDHILRGAGHSRNPGDVNCDGTLVPASSRAADNRTFTTADQQQKIKNILEGKTFNAYNAKDEKPNYNVMGIFGGQGWPAELKPDNTWVSIWLELMGPVGQYRVGFNTDAGFWDFSRGLDPPGVFSTAVPPGVRLDFAVMDMMSGDVWPISDYGVAVPDPASIQSPEFSINPVVTEPYFSRVMLHWNLPMGMPLDCFLSARPAEGFKVFPPSQGGVDQGELTPAPKLFQNMPNPFGVRTEIAYYVPAGAGPATPIPVRLSLFDARGRRVTVLVDRAMEPGLHSATLDARAMEGMASGIYFYRLEVGRETLSRRLLFIR